jgi:HD-like signal output (HDOD) protein
VITASGLNLRRRLEEEVPPFHQVAVQLLHLAGDPTVSVGQIITLLRTDAVLTMGLLQIANSPLFASRQEITDIRQAVTYLGLDLVRSVAVTAAMRGLVRGRAANPLALAFWRHSLATALTSKRMCRLANIPPESAYTAGLLHDVGQLGLIRLFPDYALTITRAVQCGDALVDAELQAFGIDHCQAGRWLLSRWRLPLELQSVVAGHERPPSKATCDQASINLVHAASLAADFMGFTVIPPAQEIEPQDVAAAFEGRLGTLESLQELVDWVLINVSGIEMSL